MSGYFFQGYSEDPYLNGQLGLHTVRGIQDQGTMASAKQIGVSPDGSSGTVAGSQLDLQTLHEVYLAAIEPLIEAGVTAVMCSYCEVNGIPSCQNDEILNLTLRGDWNFTGIVMSNWGAAGSVAILGATGRQLNNGGEGFGERSFETIACKVAPIDALKSTAPSLNITYSVGVDMHGTVIPASAFRTADGQQGLGRNNSISTSITVDANLDFSGAHALDANTDYTWTGQLLANTTGWHRIALQRHYPHVGSSVFSNSTYWNFYGNTMTINGSTTDSYRIYLDGGVHAWSGPVTTLDGWDETGVDAFFEAGPQNISITAHAVFNDSLEVRLSGVTPEQREAHYAQGRRASRQRGHSNRLRPRGRPGPGVPAPGPWPRRGDQYGVPVLPENQHVGAVPLWLRPVVHFLCVP